MQGIGYADPTNPDKAAPTRDAMTPTSNSRSCIMIYALDVDGERTSSLGILNYTRHLVQAMAAQPDPGFDVCILTSASGRDVVPPSTPPEWMRVEVVGGRFGSGVRRLWADHVLCVRYAKRLKAGLVYFPKGWLPVSVPASVRLVATMHDTMN